MPCLDSTGLARQELSKEDCPLKAEKPERLTSASTVSGSPTESTRASSPSLDSVGPSPQSAVVRAKLEALAVESSDVELAQRYSDAVRLSKDNASCRQMVMRMIRMLRLCDYETEMIVLILAVALVHLDKIFRVTDARMEDTERVSIAVLQCFNSHCYVMDEACPMKYWQSNIYSSYCNVKVLNSAAFKLLKILKFSLSATEEEVSAKRNILQTA